MRQAPAYVMISLVFFILIGMGFAYSYFFYPNRHPLPCLIKSRTGKDCPTCGFSRAFSYYSHAQFEEGARANPLSWPVFLFFGAQLLMRSAVVIRYLKNRRSAPTWLIIWDSIISISFFLLAFLPIILKF